MNDVLYLVHTTNHDPSKYTELRVSTDIEHQFPGVYFSLITKQNRSTEHIYPGKYIMIFSAELLNQRNYHINLRDYNGIITETNTYFPWNIEKAIARINADALESNGNHANEVVFHDNIPMNYRCRILEKSVLPIERYINDEKADMTKLPFYLYCFEHRYTGANPLMSSSPVFFRNMAILAGLDPIPETTDAMIEEFIKKVPYFLEHRGEQRIDALRNNSRTSNVENIK